MALAIPRLAGQAIDQVLSARDVHALIFTALAVFCAGLVRSGLTFWLIYQGEYLSQKVAYDLRNTLYDRLQRLSFTFHDRSQTGQLMSRATADVEAVRMFVGFALLRGGYFLVLLVAIALVLFFINWKLALLSTTILPFLIFRTVVVNRRLRQIWADIQEGIGALGSIVQENLVGARLVRAFAREDFESRKFRRQAEIIYRREVEGNDVIASHSPIVSFALLFTMGGILWYGGRQVIAGVLTQGELAQFLLYVGMLQMPLRILGWITILFSRAMSAGARIFDILDSVCPVMEKPDAVDLKVVAGSVRFEKVSFGYDIQGNALRDVDFQIEPGQVVALVGGSGSGKSTVANLIPRFYEVSCGRITIDGYDIRDLSLVSLRRNIGIVHQDTFLFSASIRENIAYGLPDATPDEIEAAARAAQLHEFILGLPEGYETRVGERGVTLSGGQKQRLAIARTLLLDPKILIMDDSTSSVDTRTEILINRALAELLKGRTTFIIAQRLQTVKNADLILVLEDGGVVESGSHDALIARNGVYRHLYERQFHYAVGRKDSVPSAIQSETAGHELFDGDSLSARPAEGRPLDGRLSDSDDTVFGKPYDRRMVFRLAKYFAVHKVAVVLTTAATLLYTLTIAVGPYLSGLAIDGYIIVGNIAGLDRVILLFLVNALCHMVSYYTQIRAEAAMGQGVLLNLRCQIFDHLQRLSVRFFDRNAVGRIMSRVQNDVGQLGDFLDSGAFWVIGEVISLAAIASAMFGMDLPLALITLSVVPVLCGFTLMWQKGARRSFIQVRQTISAVNAALQENIAGVRVIQSLSREDLNARRFEQVNRINLEANISAGRISAAMMPAVELLMALATAFVIVFGGFRVLQDLLLVGTLVAFALYIQRFFDPIRALTMEYAQLQRAMASSVRVFELLDVKPEITDIRGSIQVPRLKGEICFEDVTFGYEPGLEVLHEINVKILPGETVALVGPTGAGKSTFVSLIARFYDVTRGCIRVDGYDVRKIRQTSYRQQLGLVLQDPILFSGTILENLRYGRLDAADAQLIAAAKTVGAHDFIGKLAERYDTRLQERGQNLSMGQRQLICFARALVADPAILLLDEATANLDSLSESILQQALKTLLKHRTAVIIAHRLSTIQDADRIVVLDKGRIVEEGSHEALLAHGGLYRKLTETAYAS